MANTDTVTLVGNLTRDPEMREVGDTIVADFGLAVNRRYPDRNSPGDWKEEANYFDVSAWGQLAENVAESLSKGDRVIIHGRLKYRSWETPEGDKRSKVDITADGVGPSLEWASVTSIVKNPKKGAADDAPPDTGDF